MTESASVINVKEPPHAIVEARIDSRQSCPKDRKSRKKRKNESIGSVIPIDGPFKDGRSSAHEQRGNEISLHRILRHRWAGATRIGAL